jgi:2-dehydro-3-deoxygluconokinase
LGLYFLESGANQRASTVIYDRTNSCISGVRPEDFDWRRLFAGATWFHTTGITPALSQDAADTVLAAARIARSAGLEVSVDLNYRKKLWNYGQSAVTVMRQLAEQATVLIANEEDIQKCLGIEPAGVDVHKGHLDPAAFVELAAQVKDSFPLVHSVAITLRVSHSASQNGWGALLHGPSGVYHSPSYQISDIVDRVGGGDSFAAGLIFGLNEYPHDHQKALDFAVAASCLKHSILGDFNLSTRAEIEALIAGDASGRVQR